MENWLLEHSAHIGGFIVGVAMMVFTIAALKFKIKEDISKQTKKEGPPVKRPRNTPPSSRSSKKRKRTQKERILDLFKRNEGEVLTTAEVRKRTRGIKKGHYGTHLSNLKKAGKIESVGRGKYKLKK